MEENKLTLKEKISKNLEGTTGNAFEKSTIIFGTISEHYFKNKWIGYIIGFLIAVAVVGGVNSAVHGLYNVIAGPSEPKFYKDVGAYEIINEMIEGVQPPRKNEKLIDFFKQNKGVRIYGTVAGVKIDGNTPVVTIVPFLKYDSTNDHQSRMAQKGIAIQAENKETIEAMKKLRRGDFVYISSTYLGFNDDDDDYIHFAGFKVEKEATPNFK
jgi:hypothetical protein